MALSVQDPRIQEELREGETLLWAGRPLVREWVKNPWFFMGILFTAFAGFAIYGVLIGLLKARGGSQGADVILLFLGVFLLVGIALLCSPLWQLRSLKRTLYALTDQRAIIWSEHFMASPRVTSYGKDLLSGMASKIHADGSGHLVFERQQHVSPASFSVPLNFGPGAHGVGFIWIERVRDVETLIRERVLRA